MHREGLPRRAYNVAGVAHEATAGDVLRLHVASNVAALGRSERALKAGPKAECILLHTLAYHLIKT
jgi:hypothetical protein